MFFSEVEVLRAHQSTSPRDAVRHVAFDGVGAGLNADPIAVVASVPTECSLLLFHVYKVCLFVFSHSQQSFISYTKYLK